MIRKEQVMAKLQTTSLLNEIFIDKCHHDTLAQRVLVAELINQITPQQLEVALRTAYDNYLSIQRG